MLSIADLQPVLAPFATARGLPGAAYVSPEVLAVEQAGLFAGQWVCAGREADVARAGDWFSREIAGDSVLVLRGQDGVLRAFFNVCRHRGSRLLTASGGTGLSRVTCPYHAWTYASDGSLAVLPRTTVGGGGADGARASLGLVPVVLALRDGFIFLNPAGDAPAFATAFADLPDFSRFRLAELRAGWRGSYDVAANWKLIAENYSECYHCPGAHPQLARLSDLIARTERPMECGSSFNGGPMALREGVETMSLSGRRTVAPIPGLSAADHRYVYYYVVYPNLLLSPHPDYVLTHTIWPLAPDLSRVECELLFTPEALDTPGFNPADMADFWDVTNRQDWALCEGAQQGVSSRGYRPGPYQPGEDCVHTFDRWYANAMAGLLTRA